ncbi:MAG: response regulator [Bacteroidota bacterium]
MEFSKPKNIFIVDDDEMFAEALSDYLTRKAAHKISIFLTGEDCMQHLIENPDVVILDYYMNTVKKDAANGLQVLEAIQNQLPGTRFIMLSSQESYGIAAQTIQKGAEQYVIKDGDAFQKIADLL